MKDLIVFVRYCGTSANRFHILQRGDGQIWTGEGWSRIMDCAKHFKLHRDAQREYAALARQRYGGKPMRSFKMEVSVALVADDVSDISQEQLADYIARAVRVDVENSVHNNGPIEGSFVELRLLLATLKETESTRKRF
jgi:hypothetical protein